MNDYDVTVGLDVGKGFHHMYALSKDGKILANKTVIQSEQDLTDAFVEMKNIGSTLVVVDQPNNIGALSIALARRTGCDVAYLPGLAMRRAAGILPGDAKTDKRDAFVICMTAKSMPQSLRVLPSESALRADVSALAAYDDDCRCDMTREINRLRSHLIESHPVFERALKDDIASTFVLKLLEKYGGPWGMQKVGKTSIYRWASKEKRVPQKTLERLIDAVWSISFIPNGAALREEFAIPACVRRIQTLIDARKHIASRLQALLADDPTFLVLNSMPGIGIKTAVALIVHVDINAFEDVDHLASYAGIAPKTHQSGTSIKGESCAKMGNRALKSALFLSAFASLKNDPLSKEYYDKKRAEGKRHNAAIICLARRRLKIMYALMRDLKPYRLAV